MSVTADVMREISLGALSETYKSPSDDDFTASIAAKREFQIIDPQKIPEKGQLFPHQKLSLRYLDPATPYKELMVFWATGAGKTRFALEIIKRNLHNHEMYGTSENSMKPIIIMEKSIKAVWEMEMMKMPEFQTEKLRTDYTYKAQGRRKAATDAIKRYVELRTQDKFTNDLAEMDNETIARKFAGRLIIIDEFQTTRTTVTPQFDADGVITNDSYTVEKKVKQGDEYVTKQVTKYVNKRVYVQLRRLMTLTDGVKIGLSASFMPDKPSELVSVTSLFLPAEKQLSLDEFNAAFEGGRETLIAYLEPRLRGYISYVPANQGTARFITEGEPFERIVDGVNVLSEIRVVNIQMTPTQDAIYALYADDEEGDGEDGGTLEGEESNKRERFYIRVRKASIFVYLDPQNPATSRSEGFEFFEDFKEIEDPKGGKKVIRAVQSDGFVQVEPPLHRTFEEKRRAEEENRDVKLGKLDAKDRTAQRRTKIGHHIFTFRFERQLFANVPPRPRNLHFKGEQSAEELRVWRARLEVIRSFSAKYAWIIDYVHNNLLHENEGEMTYYYYPWIRDGGGILLGMCFDLMGYVRFNGDTDRISELPDRPTYAYYAGNPASTTARNKNILEIANHPSNAYGRKIMIVISSDVGAVGLSFLNVRKFIHGGASFTLFRQPLGRTKRLDSHLEFPMEKRYIRTCLLAATRADGSQTIDHKIWFDIQNKEVDIELVEDSLRAISTDCAFSAQRDDDVTGQCIGVHVNPDGTPKDPLPIDYSTYHKHWASDEFDAIEYEVRQMFRVKSSLMLDEMMRLFRGNYNPSTVVWTLARMLSRRDVIRDRYGLNRILREQNGIYFISDLLDSTDISSTHYVDYLHIPYPVDGRTLYSDFTRTQNRRQVTRITDSAEFNRWWDTLESNTEAKVELLEAALLGQIEQAAIKRKILTDLRPTWFIMGDCIFHYYQDTRPKGTGGGYGNNKNRLGNDATIRIACAGDVKFRVANAGETTRLVKEINRVWEENEQRIVEENNTTFLGILNVSSDNGFRIKLVSSIIRKDGKRDGRGNRGQKISSYERHEVVGFLWEIGVENPTPPDHLPGGNNLLRQRIAGIMKTSDDKIASWSREKLIFFFNWLEDNNTSTSELNELLFQALDIRGMILRK